MFREMRRFKQAVSAEKCIEVLTNEPRGVLSVIAENGYPYGFPINHIYDNETGKIYFHGAKQGHKVDAIKKCDKVSLCVYDSGYRKDGEWALNITSVIVFGKIKMVDDVETIKRACKKLCLKFADEAYYEKEISQSLKNVQLFEITPEHMSGKLVNES